MTEDEIYLGKKDYSVLGQRPVRHDGADKVTGRAIYAADVQLPNMVHGKIVRSPHAHARIKSIDASEALKLPGVFAVVTGSDFPDLANRHAVMGEAGEVNLGHLAANCLALGKVLYKGQPVAAVAAAERSPGRGSGREDQGGIRGPAQRHLGPRRHEGRRPAAARRPPHRHDGQEG